MKRKKLILLTIVYICSLVAALAQSKWPAVQPEHDALMREFDRTISLARRDDIIKELEKQCRKHPGMAVLRWRTAIAKVQQYGVEACPREMRMVAAIDSAKWGYDYMRAQTIRAIGMSDYDIRKYIAFNNLRMYYNKVGDMLMEANMDGCIGGILSELGESDKALKFFHECGLLYDRLHLKGASLRNQLNIANQMSAKGDTLRAYRLLRGIENNPEVRRDTSYMARLYMSLYTYSRTRAEQDRTSRMALVMADRLGSNRLLLMCRVNRGEFFMRYNQTDSAYTYLRYGIDHMGELGDFNAVYEMANNASRIFYMKGRVDSAYHYLRYAEAMRDSIDNTAIKDKIHRSETLAEIGKYEARMALAAKKRTQLNIMIKMFSVVVIVVASVLGVKIYRKLSAEIDNRNRELITSTMMIEESHTALRNVKQALERGKTEGDISGCTASELSAIIAYYADSANNWEAFSSHFNKVHPKLIDTLKERYPALSRSDLRLCAFIRLGIESKHIAKILAVQPDSVKKARQRLRKNSASTIRS